MSITRRILKINGIERSFLCDNDDTLATSIRKLGLTGTKIGCGAGQCGACNVILNNTLVRSCVRKMSTIDDFSTVITIEGLGTTENLHPLQLAWIVDGGVQCGFCSPGFIVSAKALLDINPDPTRSEVRDWFKKNRNACRCTGYKPLVDAVMDGAAIMRGEMTVEELWKKTGSNDEKVFNTRHERPAAFGKVTGQTDYGDDIAVKSKEAWHMAPVMAGVSHANILNIDFSEAEKAPGVHKVITAKDVKGINRITFPMVSIFAKCDGFERPIINDKKIFQYGDIVALVVAETNEQARAAAKLVKVDYEELPAYMNVLEAIADDAMEIHPDIPNVMVTKPLYRGTDTREVFADAEYIVEASCSTTKQPHMPIEPDTGQAYIEEDGTVTIMYKTHAVYMARNLIAAGIGMPPEKIRIVMNPTGGAFGYSISPGFPALLGVAALATNHLVTMTLTYEEHQANSGKRAGGFTNGRIACDKDGKLLGQEFHNALDKGCYSEQGAGDVSSGIKYPGWPYYVPNIMNLGYASFTNTPNSVAYRSPGVPNIFMNYEQMMDMMAEKIGMDPLEFRLKNVLQEGQIATHGRIMGSYPYTKLFELLKPKYKELKEHAKNNSTPEKLLGVGISIGGFMCAMAGDHAEVALELNSDGTVTNYNTWQDLGQGGDVGSLTFTHEALKPLGLRPDQIKLVMSDTRDCPNTGISAGSRSNIMCGNATIDAANQLLAAMKKDDGTYRTYDEMIKEDIPVKYLGVCDRDPNPFSSGPDDVPDENTGYGPASQEYSCSSFVAEIEMDTSTGKVRVLDMHCISDIGIVTNYTSADGQAYGGMMHSIGYALSEDYSDIKKHSNLVGAGFPYIDMIPDEEHFTVTYTEDPKRDDPFGAGGASEAFQSAGHAAIMNAIYDAGGIRIFQLPATPDKVKKALEDKKNGIKQVNEKYDLGDFYGTIDYIKANPVYKEKK